MTDPPEKLRKLVESLSGMTQSGQSINIFYIERLEGGMTSMQRDSHMAGDAYSGDFRGAVVNARSILSNVTQTISCASGLVDDHKIELRGLVAQLEATLENLPSNQSAEADAIAKSVETLITDSCKENPNKVWIETLCDGLKIASKRVIDTAPRVLDVANKIVSLIVKIAAL